MLMAMGEDFQAKPTMVLDQIQDVTDGTFCDMKICHQLSTVDEGHRTCQFKLLDNTIEGAIGLCGINVEPREIELHEEYNRFKNKDLIVLELDEKSFWVGPSDFEDSFNIRHSIDPLRDGVYIIRRLTKRTILGLANNIKSITKRDLEKYIQRHYNTGLRMVIVVFEVVKLEEVVEQVKKLFTKLSSNAITAYQLVLYEPTTFIGFENADSIVLMVIEAMLGSWSKNVGDTHATSLTNYPLVLVVFKDRHQELHTTHSPQFLDLRNQHGIWSHSDYGFDVRNEVFDAGVWPELRSFLNTNLGLVPTYWKGFAKLEPDSWLKTATAN
ncbi:hypothetical protein V6N11_036822 [Hibiscus sabdariffa]|uniref:Peptidase M16 C-terminal domain-containing protein n=1 Tax=Hibiscus sabdariffa TaxID=183260 RepID=A0ABR2RC09_9ROSI